MNQPTKLDASKTQEAAAALTELVEDQLVQVTGGATNCTTTVSVDSTGKVTVTVSCKW